MLECDYDTRDRTNVTLVRTYDKVLTILTVEGGKTALYK